nr:MAG: HNH endonuclease [Bacteriophage sp.]UWG92920.1 MAG: HNH endonuclease [Bacteriophage sp.]
MKQTKVCCICGNDNKTVNTDIGILCGKHYSQYIRYGKVKLRTKYDPNEIEEFSNHAIIYLYNKDGDIIAETLIDKEDIPKVINNKWCRDKNGYVKNSKQGYLHRILLGETNLFIDHINGNKLDNRKRNLRICNNADNLKNRVKLPKNNTSGILGVRFREDRNKWYTEIQCNKEKIYLGSFSSLEEAIKARLNGELKFFGKYKSKILNNEIN